MGLNEWSVSRLAVTSLAWLIGVPVVSALSFLAYFWLRGRAFHHSTQGELGTHRLTVLVEYGMLGKAIFLILWLGPPIIILIVWLVLRGGFDRPSASS